MTPYHWKGFCTVHLEYTIIDPTKNITLLVTTPVPRAAQVRAAEYLLHREKKAEQVAFLEFSPSGGKRLQMMGGEFCGNATMAYGAWLCRQDHLDHGETADLLLEVSGTREAVPCSVTAVRDSYLGTVTMPLPEKAEAMDFDGRSLGVVHLPGICHIIAPAGDIPEAEAESLLRRWSARLPGEAAGLLLLDEASMSMKPLVYVKATDSMVWENGCGSGSAAVGAWLTKRRGGPQCISLHQPGGVISIVTTADGSRLTGLTITGVVKIGRSACAELPAD